MVDNELILTYLKMKEFLQLINIREGIYIGVKINDGSHFIRDIFSQTFPVF